MPYPTLDSLPDAVKKLPEKAQRIWQAAFNSAFDQYDGDEGRAAAVAWSAIRKQGFTEEPMDTEDIKGVEIFAAGTWNGHTYSEKDLDRMVKAHKELSDLDVPIKLGHDKGQKLIQKDGMPAAGWVTNLRRRGEKLMADLVKVPQKVADLIRSGAYAKRSAEIYVDYEDNGKDYPFVVKALALIGADTPAVSSLQDIVSLYDEDGKGYRIVEFAEMTWADWATSFDALGDEIESHIKFKTGAPDFRTWWKTVKREAKKFLDKEHTLEFAEWDTRYINDLPDSAFAYIAPGGEKDDEGKTVPRALRHLPYKGMDGEIDLPHLRNALARLPQTALSAAAKAEAKGKLVAAARQEDIGEYKIEDMMQPDVDDTHVPQPLKTDRRSKMSEDMVPVADFEARGKELEEAQKRIKELEDQGKAREETFTSEKDRLDKTEKELHEMRQRERVRTFSEAITANQWYGPLEENLDITLKLADKLGDDSEEFKVYMTRQHEQARQLNATAMLTQKGSEGRGASGPQEELEKRVAEIQKERNLDYAEAFSAACDENPRLYTAFDKARKTTEVE